MVGEHPEVRKSSENLLEVRKWSGDPPEGTEVVGEPLGGPEVVERHSRISVSGRETLRKDRK